jgi:hypothetical protein
MGLSIEGVRILKEMDLIFEVVKIVEREEYLSMRGVGLFILNMFSNTI